MSTQHNHTPGPWLVMNSATKGAVTIAHQREDQGTDFIAELPAYIGNQANAQLIAALPDFLAAAQNAQELIENISLYIGDQSLTSVKTCNAIKRALYDTGLSAAIAKATGGAQ